MYGEDGLLWTQVDKAIGASEFNVSRIRRLTTQPSSTSPTTRGCRCSHRSSHRHGKIVKTYTRKGKEPIEENEEEFEKEKKVVEEDAYVEEEADDENLEFVGQFNDSLDD